MSPEVNEVLSVESKFSIQSDSLSQPIIPLLSLPENNFYQQDEVQFFSVDENGCRVAQYRIDDDLYVVELQNQSLLEEVDKKLNRVRCGRTHFEEFLIKKNWEVNKAPVSSNIFDKRIRSKIVSFKDKVTGKVVNDSFVEIFECMDNSGDWRVFKYSIFNSVDNDNQKS